MILIALKMLSGDRAKYLGIVMGLTFAALIITQQSAIFVGLMIRTYSLVSDTPQADIWVMDPYVRYIDDVKPIPMNDLYKVRSVSGVDWAVPYYKGMIKAYLPDGNIQQCILIGVDDASLIGGPYQMKEGKLMNLKMPDGIIIDNFGREFKLAYRKDPKIDKLTQLGMGSVFELNDKRAKVVGICDITRTFQNQPIIYTTFSRALQYAPPERKQLNYVLVKAKDPEQAEALCEKITKQTGLAAYTKKQFSNLTMDYYLKHTGIPVNFGIVVVLGFVIGVAVAGQTFYNFTLDHLKFLGTFKAMGASNKLLFKLTVIQSLVVGSIGWGLGIGLASLLGIFLNNTMLSFRLPWELMLFSLCSILFICFLSALISIYKIFKLEPAIVFKS
ncbi:MAG: ABC transporter permease [Rhabdochlamydiaceae bacterium]|nr:ABC transporter permease [Candidatus Amphrikana amoebophyrae]